MYKICRAHELIIEELTDSFTDLCWDTVGKQHKRETIEDYRKDYTIYITEKDLDKLIKRFIENYGIETNPKCCIAVISNQDLSHRLDNVKFRKNCKGEYIIIAKVKHL